MSCWIVPTLAAEYLGVSIDELLFRVRAGMIPTKTENGFTFVDVAPNSPRFDEPVVAAATFVEVTREEFAALHAPAPEPAPETEARREATAAAVVREPHWTRVRRQTSAVRRPCMA